MDKMTVVAYLKMHLNDQGDFLQQYKNLSAKDKEDLKKYAEEEMIFKGITIQKPANQQ